MAEERSEYAYTKKSAWESFSDEQIQNAFDFCKGYKEFLTMVKTEREAIDYIKNCKSVTDISKFLKSRGISNKQANEIVYFIKSLPRNDGEGGEGELDQNRRNDTIDLIDDFKLMNFLDDCINKLK